MYTKKQAIVEEVKLKTEPYLAQAERWPSTGRHILAQYDEESVVVYQAYRPEIGHFAATHGYFGGAFSLGRMSWIKPNFLWMMYRSGWGTKPGQEVVLAIRLARSAFDEILARAVHSSYVPDVYDSREDWQRRGKTSDVRLQWDPDHAPCGTKQERRAIQLGLRGQVLSQYASKWVIDIEDVSEFVAEQRRSIDTLPRLVIPRERAYPVADAPTRAKLRVGEVEYSE